MSEYFKITDPRNKVIIDWVSFTSKEFKTVDQVMCWLGLADCPWQQFGSSGKGFRTRFHFNGVSIHCDHKDMNLFWVEMSGQGCRSYETFGKNDFQMIFDFCLAGYGNITRLDVAYDDIEDEILDIKQIADDTVDGFYKSHMQYWNVQFSSVGTTVVHGSPQSHIRIRIYDKAAERKCAPGTHWVRVELQLRDERALGYLALYRDAGECFGSVIYNYLTYCKRTKDTNKSRWVISDYWARFLAGVGKMSIYTKPGVEYNFQKLEEIVIDQYGAAIGTYMNIVGVDEMRRKLAPKMVRRNPKYVEVEYNARGFVEV